MTTSTISAKIPQDQRDRLDAIAAAEDIAVSRLVATAIEQYLQQPAIGPQTETEAPTMPPHYNRS
jgi:predicted transcriptional regulator